MRDSRYLLAVLFALAAVTTVLGLPEPAAAATCSQYPNQAAAQFAGDTVDADKAGIFCESLPCPCSTAPPGTTTPPPPATPPPVEEEKLFVHISRRNLENR